MNIYDYIESKGVYLARKTKNAIKKANPDNRYIFNIKDISVNGQKRGCSGFITNQENNSTVYITTEYCPAGHFMYKYTDGPSDYKGYRNRWDGKNSLQKLAECIVKALQRTPVEAGEIRI